jgi:hypothetical protein
VTLLGEEQWAWLERQLRQPAEVRFIASSTQIVADQKGMDEWGNYPHERSRLFDLIEIDWSAESGPLLHLKVVGVDNSTELEYTVPVPHPNR